MLKFNKKNQTKYKNSLKSKNKKNSYKIRTKKREPKKNQKLKKYH